MGATFTVTLRAMETSLLNGPVYFVQNAEPSAHRARILLVEDHADTARVLLRLLERCGYDTQHANRIGLAEEVASQQAFDLVISDVGLPDGSGLDLMRKLRQQHGLTGIALSGYGMDEDRAASVAAGFAEHFTTPVDSERLRAAVDRLLRSNAAGRERQQS